VFLSWKNNHLISLVQNEIQQHSSPKPLEILFLKLDQVYLLQEHCLQFDRSLLGLIGMLVGSFFLVCSLFNSWSWIVMMLIVALVSAGMLCGISCLEAAELIRRYQSQMESCNRMLAEATSRQT